MQYTSKPTDHPTQDGLALSQARVLMECRIAKTARVNLLVVGPTVVTEAIINTLWWPDPARTWTQGGLLELPSGGGVLFLHDVGNLSRQDQQRLKHWLKNEMERAQVVSTSPAPIMLRVAAGAFDADLYYRLNTVCVHTAEM